MAGLAALVAVSAHGGSIRSRRLCTSVSLKWWEKGALQREAWESLASGDVLANELRGVDARRKSPREEKWMSRCKVEAGTAEVALTGKALCR